MRLRDVARLKTAVAQRADLFTEGTPDYLDVSNPIWPAAQRLLALVSPWHLPEDAVLFDECFCDGHEISPHVHSFTLVTREVRQ